MSVKKLFTKSKPVSSTNLQTEYREVESAENFTQQVISKDRFIPSIDYTTASNFAFFGSAEEYYKTAFYNILNRYPYDGSSKEVREFLNNSSYLDLYVFENKYPRNNGYITISSNGWGTLVGSKISGFGKPDTLEYISVFGGPNTASEGMEGQPLSKTFDYSNKYDTNIYENAGVLADGRVGTRESNLKTNFDNGVTLEFWLKKSAFDTSKTEKEVIFDLWNGEASSSLSCGRIILALTGNVGASDEGLYFLIQSGSTMLETAIPGYATGTIADNNWHHYAVSMANSGSNIAFNFYLDGSKVFTNNTALSDLGEITGSLKATIGALQTCPPNVLFHGSNCIGSAKLSASLDEFRFWKSARDQEQIVDNRWVQVGGGTNTDISNTELGVYFKFNEGITGQSAYDSIVLDYSGRITNGTWVGYPGSTARSTGSAMVQSGLADYEFKDPVIYDIGTDYQTAYNDLLQKGLEHDYKNTTQLYKTFPAWIIEDDENASQEMKKLTQVVSSVFDTMHILIGEANKVKDVSYQFQTPLSESILGQKPFPHNQRLLESYGLMTDELFQNQSLLEFIQNRTKETQFDFDLTEIKNEIYRNIYNNLVYIYKSKGTEKSIRNMLRSIGINEEILKLNAYANNNEFLIENTYSDDTFAKKYINFADPDHFSATVFQSASSNVNTNNRSYISGALNQYDSFTTEVNVLFPSRLKADGGEYFETNFTQSSIFGLHVVQNTGTFDWPSVASQDTNFEVYAVTPEANSDQCYFLLRNRAGTLQVTSSLYKNVYSNSEWTFGVRVYNDKYPINGPTIAGSSDINYKIDFMGYNTEGTFVRNNFKIVTEVTDNFGSSLVTSNKRYYAGANRQNFTGSVQSYSDVRIGSIRHYDTFVEDEAIKVHSIDRSNFGVLYPQNTEYLLNGNSSLRSKYVPKILFNTINVDFETVTGSDSSGKFLAVDFSSGSSGLSSRYPDIGTTLYTQHEFTGYGFKQSSTDVVKKQIIIGSNLNLPEAVNSSDLVNILERDDELFTRDNSIVGLSYALEKSYYGVISKDMLDFFGGVVAFNNLIGDVSNKYKLNYDKLEFLRSNFFEKVTSLSTLERFYSFYKWIDDSIGNFVAQLVPGTANFENNIRDLIESHILERNKIRYMYPILDYYGNSRFGEPKFEAVLKGAKQLRREWILTSPPFINGTLTNDQSYHTAWWKDYVNRTSNRLTSGNNTVDAYRELYKIKKGQFTPEDYTRLKTESGQRYTFLTDNSPGLPNTFTMDVLSDKANGTLNSVGINTKFNKSLNTFRNLIVKITKTGSPTLIVQPPSVEVLDKDKLDIRRNIKRKHEISSYSVTGTTTTDANYITGDSEKIVPFTFLSKSVSDGYASEVTTAEVNNIHSDSVYNDMSISLQGPFTETHTGGNQHRHQGLQTSPTNIRAEAFKIFPTANGFQIKGPQGVQGSNTPDTSLPFAIYRRDVSAKRPFNIANIKNTTSTIGNFAKENEFVFTNSRTANNRAFVKAEGFSTGSTLSGYINNFYDYAKPNRDILSGSIYGDKQSGYSSHVIVNRFSAPGGPETAGDNQGGPGLDYQAAEFSPYNNINFRNLTVRNPLRTFLTSRMEQFGIASGSTLSALDYNNTASFHKQHRNGRSVVTQNSSNDFSVANSSSLKTRYDNAYVETPVPGDEIQYSWITASATTSTIVGYQDADGYDYTNGVLTEQLNFVSSSDVVSYKIGSSYYFSTTLQAAKLAGVEYLQNNTVGLNTIITDPLFIGGTTSQGYPLTKNVSQYVKSFYNITNFGRASILNTILLNRNDQYGYNTFKQVRTGERKIARKLRELNFLTFNLDRGIERVITTSSGSSVFSNTYITKYSDLYQYKEPVATTRFRPVSIVLATNKKGTIKRFEIQTNHGNNLIKFANEEANTLLNLDTKVKTPLNSVINFYKTSDKVGALELNYSEIIYPKETNLYLGRTRARQSYENNFWRDSEDDRQVKGRKYKNTSATRPAYNFRRSSWDLDEFPEFDQLNFDNYPNPNPLPLSEWFYKRPGILQNFTTFNKWYSFKIGPTTYDGYINPANLNVQPTFARTHMEYNYGSLVNKFGMDIYDPNDINLRTDLPYSSYAKASLIGSGYAKWEAPEQANKLKEIQVSGNIVAVYETTASKPFYDSYEEYAEDIRSIGKEMSIIPEFRISEHIKKISSGEVNEFTISDFLKVPNSQDSSIPNDSSKDNFFEVYSNSDFLKYFEVVRDSNKGFLYPDRLTLKCKAVKKFLPYNGFYPAERTTEIAQKFFECYGDSITTDTTTDEVSDTNKLRPTLQTMFAPGIMYNTIKSGLAVDYPIYTGSYQTGSRYTGNGSSFAYEGLITDFHKRVPFEAIYDPATHLNNLVIYDNEPMVESRIGNSTGTKTRLNNVISIGQANRDYIYAINNFLAESANLFLEDSEPTKIVSAPEDQFLSVVPGRVYGMRIKMWRSMSRSKPLSGSWGNYPVPQDMPYSAGQSFYILVNKHFLNGGSKQVLSKNTDCENFETVEVARNSTLSNLTCSITISGALNSYTFVGTGSNYGSSFGFGHYTSTTFDIDTDSSANTTDNLDNTMNALVAAINSGASTEFKASYEGQVSRTGFGAASADYFVLINNEDYCDNVTFEASTFGVVRVDVKTPYITATMAVSNSVQPSTDTYKHWIEYAGGTVGIYDQYFIITNDLEDFVNYSSTTSPIKDEILFVNSRTGSYPDSGTLSQIYHKELFTMYSRPTAFGPPMLGVTGSLTSVSLFQSAQDVGNGYNYGFTPPYYYGESWVDVLYIPQDDAQMNSINTDTNVSGSISEINKLRRPFKPFVDNKEENEKSIFRFIAPTNATIGNSNAGTFYNCIRYDYSAGDNPGTDLMAKDEKINSNAMQLSASLNMFESIVDENGKTRWVIKTKYETPHFNFNHLETPEDVFYPTGLPSASVPRGIWHQFGRIPTQEGVYMSVEAIPQNWLANSPIANYSFLNGQGYVRAETYAGIYNLAEVCGFSSTPVKVGRISPKKKVKEAIVAIPFLEVEGERQFLSIDRSRTSYIKQAINYVETLKGKIESIEDFITKAEQVKLTDIPTGNAKNIDTALESTSITEMLIKAKSYVLPPVFDYMNFNVDPINMYIFEFEHEFDKNDLSYIWQNVMPKNDQEFEVVESIVSHPLLSDELLGDYTKQIGKDTPVPTEMPENLKWLVFKIKQRANKDYKKFINKGNILNSKEEKLSYNWPYDYFSLVELAKLESEVTLTPERTKAVPENGIQLTDKGFMNLGKRGSNVIISSNLSTSDLNDSTIESINKTISNKISTVQLTDITAKETPTTIEDKQVSGIVTNAVQVKGGLASSTQIGLPNRGLVQDPRGGEAGQSFSNELTRLK